MEPYDFGMDVDPGSIPIIKKIGSRSALKSNFLEVSSNYDILKY